MMILIHPTYTLILSKKINTVFIFSWQRKKKDSLLIGASWSVTWFLGQFLANVISVRMIDWSSWWRINNVVKYTVLCVSRARDPLTFTPPLRWCCIYSWSHLLCIAWFFYSRVRETTDRRKGETDEGAKGKLMGICYPRYCFPRERAEGGSFRYGNITWMLIVKFK